MVEPRDPATTRDDDVNLLVGGHPTHPGQPARQGCGDAAHRAAGPRVQHRDPQALGRRQLTGLDRDHPWTYELPASGHDLTADVVAAHLERGELAARHHRRLRSREALDPGTSLRGGGGHGHAYMLAAVPAARTVVHRRTAAISCRTAQTSVTRSPAWAW